MTRYSMTRHAVASVFAIAAVMGPAFADVTSAEIDAIAIPDTVETAIGTLRFFDGVPVGDTVQTVYDNLDRMRATDVFLDNMGAVSINAILDGFAKEGADASNKVALFAGLMDSATLVLTANTSTLYAYAGTDLANDGPTVIEVPPGMLGFLDDSWQRFVGNIGLTGPDEGKGGKYLVLPPGYDGDVPDGYFVLKPPTNRNFLFLRGSIAKGLEPAVKNITSGLKIYPLKDAANPAATEFVNVSGKAFNAVFPNDLGYFQILDEIIQREPADAIGPEVRGEIAAIGIVKGQAFAPDERMQKLLTEAGTIGNATARVITTYPRISGIPIYPGDDSAWNMGFADKNTSFESDGAINLSARSLFYFNAAGVTPSMALTKAGEGSDYAMTSLDSQKKPFDGAKTYRLHLPPNVPVNDFWAVTIYDTQTRSQLQTGQSFPTVGSQTQGMKPNADGSFDVFFAPEPPEGKEGNWLQTVPGKSWFAILRMYGPLKPWIDKSWRPAEIEPVQ